MMFFFSVFTYINSIQNRAHSLNLDALGLPTHDLRELEMLISEEKVFAVIKEMSAKHEEVSSATTPSHATNATNKKIDFTFVKKFYQKLWMFTRYVPTTSKNLNSKFEMSSEKQKRQICYE